MAHSDNGNSPRTTSDASIAHAADGELGYRERHTDMKVAATRDRPDACAASPGDLFTPTKALTDSEHALAEPD